MDAAMNSAVSALRAQSSALSTVSDNLANAQTTGYKAVETQFNSLLAQQSQGVTYPAGGVQAIARQNVLSQGLIQNTSTSTDMAIDGNGMFPVSYGVQSAQISYTRNGAFDADAKGNLYLSGTNYYLQGWPTDTTGKILSANPDNIASLGAVNIDKYNSSAVATTSYSLQANLPAATQNALAGVPYTNTTGATENVNLSYAQIGSAAATATTDATTTYLLTVSAPAGQTISDGTTKTSSGSLQFSRLSYQVTVDNGVIITLKGATPGAATQYPPGGFVQGTIGNPSTATAPVAVSAFPSVTPSDGSAAVTWPSAWSAVPTWSQIKTTTASNFSQQTSMAVYDSLGVQQTFPVAWTPAGNNTWMMTVGTPTNPAGTSNTGSLLDSAGNVVKSYTYQVQFNSDGSLGSITPMTTTGTATAPVNTAGLPSFAAKWLDGAANSTGSQSIVINLGSTGKTDGLSQFDTGQTTPQLAVKNTSQNGVQYGQLTGVSVDTSGNVVAAYDNGQKVPIYKIPIATFPNENGLAAQTDGVYQQTSLSGNYTLNIAGQNGAGSITGSALESSNVNTAQEFSHMISAQQAYSSASQVIGTDKQMFQSLIQVVQ